MSLYESERPPLSSSCHLLATANDVLAAHSNLIHRIREQQKERRSQLQSLPSPPHELLRLPVIPSASPSPSPSPPASPPPQVVQKHLRSDLPAAKRARAARYPNYVHEEETIRNDYSQRFVDTGEWPQDWVLGAEPERRFEEYPKQQRLLSLKKAAVNEHSLPAAYLPLTDLATLPPLKFDVIVIDPPSYNWEELENLPIPSLAADPSFVFLWVGSGAGEGLERGREVLGRWGYRRCEDVVWVKTNKNSNCGPGTDPPTSSLLVRTKQHCLMGIRGTVRRSTDNWFVHCNIDTDVIIWEGDPADPTRKPPEMYTLIENFCLGTRRLEVFGRAHSLRRGWVTVMAEELKLTPEEALQKDHAAPFDKETWEKRIKELAHGGKSVIPSSQEIENLRPKSPVGRGPPPQAMSLPANPSAPQRSMGTSGLTMLGPSSNVNGGNEGFGSMLHGPQPMNMGMNMMGIPARPMSVQNVPGMPWQMVPPISMGMGMNAGQGGFGYGFDGSQVPVMMGMNPGHHHQPMGPMNPMNPMGMGGGVGMGMSMGPPQGFGYGFDGHGVGVGAQAMGAQPMGAPQGHGGMWMPDFSHGHGGGGTQQAQFMNPGMWDGSEGMMGGMDMSQWGGPMQ